MFVRDRVKGAPSEEAQALVFGPRLRAGLKDFGPMLQVHRAHATMLATQGIITLEAGQARLRERRRRIAEAAALLGSAEGEL